MALSDTDIECLNEAKKLIDKDTSRHFTIAEIARHVGLSETKLKRGFKLQYKMGLFAYLENERMEKAKFMIENSSKPLKNISASLGYRYISNFCIAFKKKFGKPPMAWKKFSNSL